MTEPAPVVVKTYQAKTNAEATQLFAADAATLGAQGYRPGQPMWVASGFARILLTPVIVLIAGYLIGSIYGLAIGAIISIAYILFASRQRKGTLTVTYTR